MKLAVRCILLLPLLAAGLLACGELPGSAPRFNLRATFDDGQPVEGATLSLDGQESGKTDSAGQLSLDVPAGQYTLQLHLDAGGGRVSKTAQSVEVGPQAQEVKIELPRPVRMLEPLEVTTSRVHLTWEESKEKNFREYKVYVQTHLAGLDETTGRLVHVGTNASQTDFVLKDLYEGGALIVSANKDLYFRVFVLKDDGSLAGSNVLHVKTPRWDNEPHFTRFYRTSIADQFAGARPIRGIAYDGSALWLLYWQAVGGYYDNDKLSLVKLDPVTREVLEEFSFEDHLVPVGLTWDGASLWVGFETRLEKFNPSTGTRESGFVVDHSFASMTWTGSHLLRGRSQVDGKIEQIDLRTGAATESLTNPFTQYGGHRASGLAYRPGELWLTDMFRSDIVIVDDSGAHIGIVTDNRRFSHMAFMGEKLVGVTGSSQVYILNIEQ